MYAKTRSRFPLRPLAAAALLALALTVTACASPRVTDPGSDPSAPAPSVPSAQSDPVDLVELWRVSDADGEGPDTWLRLEAGEFQLWRDCGMVMGSWTAGASAMVAWTYAASGGCAVPAESWMDRISSYAPQDDGWVLLDPAGETVATLAIDGAPEPIPTAAEFYTQPPVVDDSVREALRLPAPLAEDVRVPGAGELVGKWVPVQSAGDDPHVELADDGTWSGWDGCNGSGGRWALGADGELLAVAGAQTLIGCEGVSVAASLSAASRVGFVGEQLVLFDRDGSEVGTLQRG